MLEQATRIKRTIETVFEFFIFDSGGVQYNVLFFVAKHQPNKQTRLFCRKAEFKYKVSVGKHNEKAVVEPQIVRGKVMASGAKPPATSGAKPPGTERSPRRLNTFAYLTVKFACSLAHYALNPLF